MLQSAPAQDVLDLGPGYLDPELLPVQWVTGLLAAAVHKHGWRCLAYGANAGPRQLRNQVAQLIGDWDGTPYTAENILVTAGTSQILDHLAGTVAAPGDAVIVDASSYDLGCAIFRQHGLRLVSVPGDREGMLPDAFGQTVERLRRAGTRIAFAYLIPTFHNPTGVLMPLSRRAGVVDTALAHRVPIVEDCAYRPLALDGAEVPPSLLTLAGRREVVQLCSFSKCFAPGIRLGWLAADADFVRRLASGGMFASGGGLNHFVATGMAELLDSGRFTRHLTALRRGLTERRDALAAGLRHGLPDGYRFVTPGGGLYIWIRPPEGSSEQRLCAAAERRGVRILPGARFSVASQPPALRLSFAQCGPRTLRSAAGRISEAFRGLGGES